MLVRRTTQALSYFLIPLTQGFCDAGEFTFGGRRVPVAAQTYMCK